MKARSRIDRSNWCSLKTTKIRNPAIGPRKRYARRDQRRPLRRGVGGEKGTQLFFRRVANQSCVPFLSSTLFLVLVLAVRLFLEFTDVGCAFDFAADGAGKFLHLAETLVLADEA